LRPHFAGLYNVSYQLVLIELDFLLSFATELGQLLFNEEWGFLCLSQENANSSRSQMEQKMDFTSKLILDSLKNRYPTIKAITQTSQPYSGFQIFYPGLELKSGTFYVIYDNHLDVLNSPIKDIGCLVIGEPTGQVLCRDCLSIPSGVLAEKIYHDLFGVLSDYETWQKNILISAAGDRDVQALIDICKNIFGNPITVFDNTYHLIGVSNDLNPLDVESFTELVNNKRYLEFGKTVTAETDDMLEFAKQRQRAFYLKLGESLDIIVSPLWYKNIFLGMLTIPTVNKELSDYHLLAADFLSKSVAMVLWNTEHDDLLINNHIETIVAKILTGAPANPNLMQSFLKILSWELNDGYAIAIIKHRKEDSSLNEQSTLLRYMIQSILPDTLIIEIDNSFAIIQNRLLIRDSGDATINLIHRFLKQYDLVCGISYSFESFSDIASYYLQAKTAANSASYVDPLYPIAYYDNHFVEHAIDAFTLLHDAVHYIHPDIMRLYNHDKAKNSELVSTLYIYLMNDKSYSESSKKLIIHKSTLNYRLDKIKALTHSDLLSPKLRLSVLFSIKMLFLIDDDWRIAMNNRTNLDIETK
jgi:sugar diacid utilization regulator